MFKKLLGVVLSFVCVFCMSTVLAVAYYDVSVNHWAYNAVNEMSNKGILAGYPDGTFKPEKHVTRAEFAKILSITLNLKPIDSKVDFADVSDAHWAKNYINSVRDDMNHYYNDHDQIIFKPDDVASREEVTVAIVKAMKLGNSKYSSETINKFSDAKEIAEFNKNYIAIAVENGIVKGNADGTFAPKKPLTRAQVSQMMYNSINSLKYNEEEFEENSKNELEFDEKTSTIDLGEEWGEYRLGITYNEKDDTYGYLYTPTERVITISNYGTHVDKVFSTDDNGRKSYITVAKINDLENFVKVECSDVFENVKFNSKKGYVSFDNNYSNYIYYPSYSYMSYNEDILYSNNMDFASLIRYNTSQHPVENKKLSVITKDILRGSREENYIPFLCVALKENVNAVRVFDLRVDCDEYLKTNLNEKNVKIDTNSERIGLTYEFTKNIEDVEVYISETIEEDLDTMFPNKVDGGFITPYEGLKITTSAKKCYVEFEVVKGMEYYVVFNSMKLEDENGLIKPFCQKIVVE